MTMNQPDLGLSSPLDWTTKSLVFGSDHAGFETKEFLRIYLQSQGAQVRDMGCYSPESVDYPQVARALASAVVEHSEGLLGLLLCGSGNGVCISANRIPGARAALCWLPELAALARSHNNANILCLPVPTVSKAVPSGSNQTNVTPVQDFHRLNKAIAHLTQEILFGDSAILKDHFGGL